VTTVYICSAGPAKQKRSGTFTPGDDRVYGKPTLVRSTTSRSSFGVWQGEGMKINFDDYCVRCDSTVGYDPARPWFCTVCWKNRRELPSRIQGLIQLLYDAAGDNAERLAGGLFEAERRIREEA